MAKKYIKTYMAYWGYGEQDYIICKGCLRRRSVDIHHLVFRSQGGTDEVSNLVQLCRYCHNRAHEDKEFNAKLKLRNGKLS